MGDGQARETPCDSSGERKPRYKVVRAVDDRAKCPASTALYIQLAGTDPMGCARPVRAHGRSAGSRSTSRTSSFASNFASGFAWATAVGETPAHARIRAVASVF